MAFCGMQPFGHCPAVERQSRFAFWKNNVYRKRTIFDECEFYSSSCHFASCRGYALTCVAVQGSGSIRGSHVEPKQSPVTLGAPLGWLGIRRSHITDLQHHQEVVSPKGSGGPTETWRRIDSCYQFNSICIYICIFRERIYKWWCLKCWITQLPNLPADPPMFKEWWLGEWCRCHCFVTTLNIIRWGIAVWLTS